MKVGRITTAVVMVIAVLWTPQIQNVPSRWNDLQSILAYATPPIVVNVLRIACCVFVAPLRNTQYHSMAQH